jgi:hypothetical protein
MAKTKVYDGNHCGGPSIQNRIRRAKTRSAIDRALNDGQKYAYASDKTKRRWTMYARQRVSELEKE